MIEELEKKINYRFKNRDLLHTALTHSSHGEGIKEREHHNERFEFLGDSVIGLAVTDYIFRHFQERSEGELAKLRQHLVSSHFLFQVSRKIDLASHVVLGKGLEKNDGRHNEKIVSSALEALIGAVYLDSGFKIAAQVTLALFKEFLDNLPTKDIRINDYKSELQEFVQSHQKMLPVYRVINASGKPPHTHFQVAVYLDNAEIGSGQGRNRREAEQEAAAAALKNIGPATRVEKLSEVFFIKND